jgi:hypothetical protein
MQPHALCLGWRMSGETHSLPAGCKSLPPNLLLLCLRVRTRAFQRRVRLRLLLVLPLPQCQERFPLFLLALLQRSHLAPPVTDLELPVVAGLFHLPLHLG